MEYAEAYSTGDATLACEPSRTFEGIAHGADRIRSIRREIDRSLNRIETAPPQAGLDGAKEPNPMGYSANLSRLHSEIDRLEKAVSLLTTHV